MRHAEDLHPVQKTSACLHPDWLLSLPAHRIHAREQDRLHAGSFAPPQGIEQGLRAGRELLSGRKEAREQRDAYPWTYASFPNSSR